jgi:hypothetical protein
MKHRPVSLDKEKAPRRSTARAFLAEMVLVMIL